MLPRILLSLVLLFPSTAIRAELLRALAAAPDVAVSTPVAGPAAGAQTGPVAISNGGMSFVTWLDSRLGFTDVEIYATRLDRDGRPLDPRGIRISPPATLNTVIWNGSEFVVFLQRDVHEAVFVSIEGTIERRKTLVLTPQYRFVAAFDEGAATRLLFVARDGFSPAAMILDANGDPAVQALLLPPIDGTYGEVIVGGAGEGEFLVIRAVDLWGERRGTRSLAQRIGFDGRLLSSHETNLPERPTGNDALAGGKGGYLLVRQAMEAGSSIQAFRLDGRGVDTGVREKLIEGPADDRQQLYRPRILRDGDRYFVSWHTSARSGNSWTHAAEVGDVPGAVRARVVAQWSGITAGTALVVGGGRMHVITAVWRVGELAHDLFAQNADESLTASPPQLIAVSAASQRNVAVASSGSGHVAAWGELGPDARSRIFARRFPAGGEPLDPGPLELAVFQSPNVYDLRHPQAHVAAGASAYLIVWVDGFTIRGRRLDDAGRWLDTEPFAIGSGFDATVAGDGRDAMVVWKKPAIDGKYALLSRRVSLTGAPLSDAEVTIVAAGYSYDMALAWSGSEYLLVWSEGFRECTFTCLLAPYSILGRRLRSDGTRIDEVPITIEDGLTFSAEPAVAGGGGRWIVVWSAWRELRGASVTREGAVMDRDASGAGTVLDKADQDDITAQLVSHGDRFVLVMHRVRSGSGTPVQRVDAIEFDSGSDLRPLAALPRSPLLAREGTVPITFDLGSGPAGLLFAYDRAASGDAGGVTRMFVRALPHVVRRRATR